MNRILLNTQHKPLTFSERPGITYEIKGEVGRGASCIVYHAVASDHTEHLLKEYYPKHLDLSRDSSGQIVVPEDKVSLYKEGLVRFRDGHLKQRLLRQDDALRNRTSNIEGVYSLNGTEYVDMTYFTGECYAKTQETSVYDLMKRMKALTEVIGAYHEKGFLHLDIKPSNIFALPETKEMVLLFDFDSVVPKKAVSETKALSCTKEWAAPELLLHKNFCPATDLFAIGEIIFVQLFGRHSTSSERRSFVTKFDYNHKVPIFKDMNPKVFPLLDELLCHTICGVVSKRYQSAEKLIEKLDEVIKLADPKEPYLVSFSVMPEEFFIGRDNELSTIHTHLQNSNILFLSGIGGIGKSELARNYAKIHKENGDYDTVLFATYGGSWMMLVNDDTGIHIANFERFLEEKEQDYYRRKIRKLKELCDEKTLFIIDNLNEDEFEADAKHQWKDILALGCKLLITTRLREWAYSLLEIEVFSERNSLVKLFENYCAVKSDADLAAVHEIIDYVDGHTLTVELIAKQTKAGFSTPAKMLSKLKEHGIAQSGKEKVSSIKDNEQSRATAFDHVAVLFDIANLSEQEKYVLANMSLMPPGGIKAALFTDWCELKDETGENDFTAVNGLVNGGWLDRTDDTIEMHPVVAEVCIGTLSRRPDYLYTMLGYLSRNCTDYSVKSIQNEVDISEYSTLCMKISQAIVRTRLEDKCFSDFLQNIPNIYYRFGFCDQAIAARKRALEIEENLNAFDGAKVAMIYCGLGELYLIKNDLPKARYYLTKATEVQHHHTGIPPIDKAHVAHQLGKLSAEECAFGEAEKHFEDALKVLSSSNDLASIRLSSEINNDLGMLFWLQSNFSVAEQYYLNALEHMHEDNGDIVATYLNLGILYHEWGYFDSAYSNYIRALNTGVSLFGTQHSLVANAYNCLGDWHRDKQNFADAEYYLEKGLNCYRMLFGENHSDTANSYNNLGALYGTLSKYSEAKENYQKALDIWIDIYGEHSGYVAIAHGNLAAIYRNNMELCLAKYHAEKALAIRLEVYGENHADTALSYYGLAMIFEKEGEIACAQKYYEKAHTIREFVFGENHVKTLEAKTKAAEMERATI